MSVLWRGLRSFQNVKSYLPWVYRYVIFDLDVEVEVEFEEDFDFIPFMHLHFNELEVWFEVFITLASVKPMTRIRKMDGTSFIFQFLELCAFQLDREKYWSLVPIGSYGERFEADL